MLALAGLEVVFFLAMCLGFRMRTWRTVVV